MYDQLCLRTSRVDLKILLAFLVLTETRLPKIGGTSESPNIGVCRGIARDLLIFGPEPSADQFRLVDLCALLRAFAR
jgi:hypothetical protein